MKRTHFMVVGAVVPLLFGFIMMVAPDMMLSNSLTSAATDQTRIVTQWVGFAVFSIGVITFLARSDPGSPALQAIMSGNILFHVLGIGFDIYGFAGGYMSTAGLVSGLIPHALLAAGFAYFLVKSRSDGE